MGSENEDTSTNPSNCTDLGVCMFVYNGFTHDARVLKEARTLNEVGYPVTVVAVQLDGLQSDEDLGGIHVLRVPKNPAHLRLLSWFKSLGAASSGTASAERDPATGGADGPNAGSPIPRRTKEVPLLEQDAFLVVIGILFSPIFLPLYWFLRCCSRSGRYAEYPVLPTRADKIAAAARAILDVFKAVLRKVKRALYLLIHRVLTRLNRQLSFTDYYLRARSLLKGKKFTFYHAHDLNTLPIAWWLARAHCAHLIYDSHEYYLERNMPRPYSPIGKWWREKVEGFLVRRTHLNITVNETIGNALGKKYGVAPFRVIMNAPSRAMTIAQGSSSGLKKTLGIPEDRNLLLYLGAITFNRGLEEVIESLCYLEDCHLAMMGYGKPEFKDALSALGERLNVSERIHFFGPVPSEEVTGYARTADIGVAAIKNACLSYYYCSPNKVFEYVLSGLPIIASDFPELKKVVEDYQVGLTFDPEDPRDIAAKARQILDTPGFIDQVRCHADAAAEDYNWENESAKLISCYGELAFPECH